MQTMSANGAGSSQTLTSPTAHHQQHGGRIKYAAPQDLPSFPSLGLRRDHVDGDVGAAASLGWASQKKPDATAPSASAAAMLAHDGRSGQNASSKAALLATESANSRKKHTNSNRQTLPPNMWGNSAANQAFHAQQTQSPKSTTLSSLHQQKAKQPTAATPTPPRRKSLRAAKDAMAAAPRKRAVSSPQPKKPTYPDEANAAANALKAATQAHGPAVREPRANHDAGAVPYTTMGRQMFTSHPPVQPEVDEKERADVIHASAVAMARRMYTHQQLVINATKRRANTDVSDAARPATADSSSFTNTSGQFGNLQETAYNLAQKRLAQLQDEHQKERAFTEYYTGTPAPTSASSAHRFSVRGKLRRARSSSDGAVTEADRRRRLRQPRPQMSASATPPLSQADEERRRRDRQAVLAAAQRNVQAQLRDMDERVYAVTGKVTPTLLGEWELKAHAAAQARSEARRDEHVGQIDVGGGMFVEKKTVEEVAAKRVQPLLDDINEKAERERERLIALSLEEEARKREVERQRARDREVHEIHEKIKHEQKGKDKLRKEELKHEEKLQKEREKALKAEQKRQSREDKRQAKEAEVPPPQAPPHEAPPAPLLHPERPLEPHEIPKAPETEKADKADLKPKRSTSLFPRPARLQLKSKPPGSFSPLDTRSTPTTPTASGSKVKHWLKSRFTRPRAHTDTDAPASEDNKGNFIGGRKLAAAAAASSSSSSLDRPAAASMRAVALAGRPAGGVRPLQPTPRPPVGFSREDDEDERRGGGGTASFGGVVQVGLGVGGGSVSSLSSGGSSGNFFEARERLGSRQGSRGAGGFAAPRAIGDPAVKKSASPVRDSRFLENLE